MLRKAKFQILLLMTILFWVAMFPLVAVAQVANPHVVINAYRLNVRSGPGVSHSIITTVAGGTELPVTMLSVDRKWYEVTTNAGTGWVHSAYAIDRGDFSTVPWAGAPSNIASGTSALPAGAPHLVVNVSYLNVRTGPGIGHSILTAVRAATELAVIAKDIGGVWYQVNTSAGSGWVNSHFTVGRGDFSGVPTLGGPERTVIEQPLIPAGAAHLVVNTAFLNVRSGPGTSHDIITTVPGGAELAVLSIAPDLVWYEVNTASGNGWVNSRFTVGRGDFSGVTRHVDALTGSTPRAVINTYRLNIRTGPGVGDSVVTAVAGGTTLAVLGKSSDDKWFLVEGDFGRGWLRNLYVAFRGDYSQVQVAS